MNNKLHEIATKHGWAYLGSSGSTHSFKRREEGVGSAMVRFDRRKNRSHNVEVNIGSDYDPVSVSVKVPGEYLPDSTNEDYADRLLRACGTLLDLARLAEKALAEQATEAHARAERADSRRDEYHELVSKAFKGRV